MKREITITLLRRVLSYDSESGRLTWLHRSEDMFISPTQAIYWNPKWAGKEAFTSLDFYGYRQGNVFGNRMAGHRVCWAIYYGKWPKTVDHINGVRSDNRIKNLRSVSQAENVKNSKKNKLNTSGRTGVSWDRSRKSWEAYISIEGRRKSLGRYKMIEDAIAARAEAEISNGYHANHGRQE